MSEFKDRCAYFYAQTDSSYAWPNSAEGDLLQIGWKEITALEIAAHKNLMESVQLRVRLQTCHDMLARSRHFQKLLENRNE